MKREIKFRGIKKSDNKFITGDLNHFATSLYIFNKDIDGDNLNSADDYEVIPETLGQYTGLKDKNGNEIYEGDIIKVNGETEKYYENIFEPPETVDFELITEVFYNDLIAGFDLNTIEKDLNMTNWGFFGEGGESHLEIIGNIHENKELIE